MERFFWEQNDTVAAVVGEGCFHVLLQYGAVQSVYLSITSSYCVYFGATETEEWMDWAVVSL